MRTPFLHADWRYLLLFHYQIDPTLLRPLVPAGTELDDWNGATFVSLLAFRFLKTRVLGLPVPLHRDFEEMNLRFYVRRAVAGQETRHGVVFIREVVPRKAVALAARMLYHEPYITLDMRSEVQPGPPPAVKYSWHIDGRWDSCAARGTGAGSVPPPQTFDASLGHREWGYTRQPDGSTIEYRVDHPRWNLWPVPKPEIEADFVPLYGVDLALTLARPHSAFVADGSAVTVSSPTRMGDR
ncbi:MAG: DUF2071 domain-containing protein [Gemmatimonadetes bacterium]|nr:DUF2071 domain-containing protein [Gemmatimonadota bacterium]